MVGAPLTCNSEGCGFHTDTEAWVEQRWLATCRLPWPSQAVPRQALMYQVPTGAWEPRRGAWAPCELEGFPSATQRDKAPWAKNSQANQRQGVTWVLGTRLPRETAVLWYHLPVQSETQNKSGCCLASSQDQPGELMGMTRPHSLPHSVCSALQQ